MKKKIWLIEDEEMLIEMYTDVFKLAKLEIETTRTGYESLEKLKRIREGKERKPDLILLDLLLPDINGIQILEEIRKYEETRNLPVFILSNYAAPEMKEMGIELKAEKFLLRIDYTPSQLVKIIKERLGEK
jgi:CheY-like chemotaxis protein